MSNELATWKKMDTAFEKMSSSVIDFCKLVSEMPEKQTEIAERYKVSRETVKMWNGIGGYNFGINDTGLPSSVNTLYQITTLTKEQQ